MINLLGHDYIQIQWSMVLLGPDLMLRTLRFLGLDMPAPYCLIGIFLLMHHTLAPETKYSYRLGHLQASVVSWSKPK